MSDLVPVLLSQQNRLLLSKCMNINDEGIEEISDESATLNLKEGHGNGKDMKAPNGRERDELHAI